MLAIKLSRYGKKKQPTFRLIVLEKTKDPWGDYLENLGTVNPRSENKAEFLKADRIKYWLEKGAQPTDTVKNLLIDAKIMKGEKAKTVFISRDRAKAIAEEKAKNAPKEEPKKEEPKAEAAPEAPAAA